MDTFRFDEKVSSTVLFCTRCHYQVENVNAKCRSCGRLVSSFDDGRPDKSWFGLFKHEFDGLSPENQRKHTFYSKCRQSYFPGSFSYVPMSTPEPVAMILPRQESRSASQVSTPTALQETPQQSSKQKIPVAKLPTLSQSSAPSLIPTKPISANLRSSTVVQPKAPNVRSTTVVSGTSQSQQQPASLSGSKPAPKQHHGVDLNKMVEGLDKQSPKPASSIFPSLATGTKVTATTRSPAPLVIPHRLAADPVMPKVPCSWVNPLAWPEDYWPKGKFEAGFTRTKVWPNARCTCGQPHPTILHNSAHNWNETFHPVCAEKLLHDSDWCTTCKDSARRVHTTYQHGRWCFFDHPDNPPCVHDILIPFLRPWPKVNTIFKPLPMHFYKPGLFPHPGSESQWPHLPAQCDNGFKSGLFDVRSGDKGKVQVIMKLARGPKKEKPSEKKQAQGSRPLPTDSLSPQDTSSDKTTIKLSAEDRCICMPTQQPHHPAMPCPRLHWKSLCWFNKNFESAIHGIIITDDLITLKDAKSQFEKHILLAPKSADDKKKSNEARTEAYDIYCRYIPLWFPGVEKLAPADPTYPIALKNLHSDRQKMAALKKSQQLRSLPKPLPLITDIEADTANLVSGKASKGKGQAHNPTIYSPFYGKLNPDLGFNKAPWGRPEDEFHPQIDPDSNDLAQQHIVSWSTFMRDQLTKGKINSWREWFDKKYDLAWQDFSIYLSYSSDKDMWEKHIHNLGVQYKSCVVNVCSKLRTLVDEAETGDHTYTTVTIKGFVSELEEQRKIYQNRLFTARQALWDTTGNGLGFAIEGAVAEDSFPHWKEICGGILPNFSTEHIYLHRFIWPAEFEISLTLPTVADES